MPKPGQHVTPLAKARMAATTRRTKAARIAGKLDAAIKEIVEADKRVAELEAAERE